MADTIEEVNKQIAEIENLIQEFSGLISPISGKQKDIELDLQELKKAFDLKYQEFNEAYKLLSAEKRDLELKLNVEKNQLQKLSAEKARLIALQAAAERAEALEKEILPLLDTLPAWSKAKQHQREDVLFSIGVYKAGLKGIINANDMGLGKTYETIVTDYAISNEFYLEHGRLPLTIYLTKKSLVKSSAKELAFWNPDKKIVPIVGANSAGREALIEMALSANAMIVTNYESLGSSKLLLNTPWDFVYIDEVHRLKGGAVVSKPTQLWLNAKQVCDKAKFPIFMSGTPIENHPREMWAYLHIFNPVLFPTLRQFEREYCVSYGDSKVDFEKLIKVMGNQTIRRRKDEVGIDLPDLSYIMHEVELSGEQAKLYSMMRDQFFIWLDEQGDKSLNATSILTQLSRLRQLVLLPSGIKFEDDSGTQVRIQCNESAKLDEAQDIIEEIVGSGEQVVIFSSQYIEPLHELKRRLELSPLTNKNNLPVRVEVLTGDNSWNMGDLENRFQQGETDVLCINMQSGAEGLNLQKNPDRWPGGAYQSIFLDQWWTPTKNRQCRDRIYREGQTHAVSIHILHAANTVDEFVSEKLAEKTAMIDGIMESSELRKGSDWRNYLSELI